MLKINGLTKKFQRNGVLFRAVNEIDLAVEQGDLVQIIGRSGSGKTTFLNLVTGLLKPELRLMRMWTHYYISGYKKFFPPEQTTKLSAA